jgi:hypothetical protein
MGARSQESPWWITGGSEVCVYCGQSYAFQMERRCAACDAPMCSICATANIADEIVCCTCDSKTEG